MSTLHEPAEPDREAQTVPASEARDLAPKGASIEPGTTLPAVLWAGVVAASLLAGVLAWAVGETTYNHFRPSAKAQQNRFEFAALNREENQASQKNAAVAYGTFGALLGLLLGAAGGLSRESGSALSTASLTGLAVGGVGAALAAYGMARVVSRFYSDVDPSLMLSVLVRGSIAAVLGLAAGLALGLGRFGRAGVIRPLIGGLVGGVLGIVAFEVLYAVAFPFDRNDNPIPGSSLARLSLYVLTALGAAVGSVIASAAQAVTSSPSLQPGPKAIV